MESVAIPEEIVIAAVVLVPDIAVGKLPVMALKLSKKIVLESTVPVIDKLLPKLISAIFPVDPIPSNVLAVSAIPVGTPLIAEELHNTVFAASFASVVVILVVPVPVTAPESVIG